MRRWRVGYLPQDASGLLRGRIVYPMLSESGELLTWFGRDPDFEEKHRQWAAAAKPSKTEPVKTKFVKGFHRGLELFGQQADRLKAPGVREAIAEHGIVVVEGPNDVIALDGLGVPAVGICGTVITEAQAKKVARWALSLSDGRVTLLLDCDDPGEAGAKESLWMLAQAGCRVQLGWSRAMHGRRFATRQPESLSQAEWAAIAETLRRRP
jgi:5S rRNA maturation endonuclease (ribonuclease M5)